MYARRENTCADDAMYKVKKNGKNDFAYYEKPTEE